LLTEETVDKASSIFVLPEVFVGFYPCHGDILCFSPKTYYHYTRRLEKRNLLGLAFFQKCSLFRQLRKLTLEGKIEYIDKKSKSSIIELREHFEEKKAIYKDQCLNGQLTLDDVPSLMASSQKLRKLRKL
jgi:hypothetical protein